MKTWRSIKNALTVLMVTFGLVIVGCVGYVLANIIAVALAAGAVLAFCIAVVVSAFRRK